MKVAEKLHKTFQGMTEKQIEEKYNVKQLENVLLMFEWHAARSGYFSHYLTGYGEPNMSFRNAAYQVQEIIREFGIKKMNILDCGCGFGFQSIMFSLLDNDVTGITFDKEEASIFSKIIKYINNDEDKNLLPVLGDAVHLPFRDSYFDVAWLHEFISHISSVIGVVQEVYRALKNGGIVIISDTSKLNLRAHYIHFKSRIKDKRWENLYEEKRRRIITEFLEKWKVTLSDRVIDDIAENTAGLTRTQIEDSLHRHIYGKSDIKQLLKKYGCNFKYRDPTTGFYNERLFYAYQIRSTLLRVGFRNVTIGIPYVVDPKFMLLNNPSLRKIMQSCIFRPFWEVAVGASYWVYAFK